MNFAIIVAAGKGRRLQSKNPDSLPKQFYKYHDKPLWWHSAQSFNNSPLIEGIIFVFHKDNLDFAKDQVEEYKNDFSVQIHCVAGGERRQDSVRNGLLALPKECKFVAIHDAARPFVTTKLITSCFEFLSKNSDFMGVVPALEVIDTIKVTENDSIVSTPKRKTLRAVQTPQCFQKDIILNAHEKINMENIDVTDDASILEYYNEKVYCIEGELTNKKITHVEDLSLLQEEKMIENITCVGYDVHAYTDETNSKARPMKLGSVPIPTKICIKAHSDGDVLLHALMDGLLSLIAAGDIGKHFPDTNKEFENISSAILLDKVLEMINKHTKIIRLVHVDITIVAQEPRISPHTAQIQKNIAHMLSLPHDCVNIKATTEEKLGFTGDLKGIKATALISATRETR